MYKFKYNKELIINNTLSKADIVVTVEDNFTNIQEHIIDYYYIDEILNKLQYSNQENIDTFIKGILFVVKDTSKNTHIKNIEIRFHDSITKIYESDYLDNLQYELKEEFEEVDDNLSGRQKIIKAKKREANMRHIRR